MFSNVESLRDYSFKKIRIGNMDYLVRNTKLVKFVEWGRSDCIHVTYCNDECKKEHSLISLYEVSVVPTCKYPWFAKLFYTRFILTVAVIRDNVFGKTVIKTVPLHPGLSNILLIFKWVRKWSKKNYVFVDNLMNPHIATNVIFDSTFEKEDFDETTIITVGKTKT